MKQATNVARWRLLLITGSMLLAAIATGIGLFQGYDSLWSIIALLAFLFVGILSGYELYR